VTLGIGSGCVRSSGLITLGVGTGSSICGDLAVLSKVTRRGSVGMVGSSGSGSGSGALFVDGIEFSQGFYLINPLLIAFPF
jgi:hypothetical protein